MVGSKNESSTLLKIEQNCSYDSKLFIVKNGTELTLKTDTNFKGTNTRHMSHSGKSQCILFFAKTLPLKNDKFLETRKTYCYKHDITRFVDRLAM